MRKVLVLGGTLIAIGGGTLHIKRELPDFAIFGFDLGQYGIAAIVLGIVFCALAYIIPFVRSRVQKGVETLSELIFKEWRFVKTRVQADELPVLYKEFDRFFGSDIVALEEMTTWLRRNPDITWRIIGSRGNGPEQPVGFFELIPLTRPAVSKLDAGGFDARQMTLQHVSSRGNRVSAYYVGSVAAVSDQRRYKFATMYKLLEHLRDLASESAITLYARPVTSDGMRLVREYNFKKISPKMLDNESAWKVHLQKGVDFSKFERIYQRMLKT